MKTLNCTLIFAFLLLATELNAMPTDTLVKKRPLVIHSISEIPHQSLWEKWMWVHRSFTYEITKDRAIRYDTAFIKSYYKRLVISLPISTRFLKFSLTDAIGGNKLVFAPNLQYNLGLSISSRWACFIVNTGIKFFNRDNNTKGKTKFQDYQLNLYGRKFTTDMFVQYYSGFYIKNTKSYPDFISEQSYAIRPDVYALHLGVSSYYIVNNRKFSYGNSFSFIEQQKKSSGSVLLGIYYSYFDASAPVSLVSEPFRNSFDSLSFIRYAYTHNYGINLGYIYTLVFLKECYATASFVQGIGAEHFGYTREDNFRYHNAIIDAGKLNLKFATGYNNGRYIIGLMGMTDYFLVRQRSNSLISYSNGKFMLYVGYRFSVLKPERKLLKKLNLIGY